MRIEKRRFGFGPRLERASVLDLEGTEARHFETGRRALPHIDLNPAFRLEL
ncbi:MAG TPA: hypothetical protein VE221_02030 [Sphingomicrobium sp.]|nr:hypothetical protein [Sphingomicrobium sp.]